MLISFAVAVIGGTSLKGGVVNPVGIFFSSYLIVMVKNGLVMLDANIYFEQVYLGMILLIAVSVESIRYIIEKRRLAHRLKNAQMASKA
jgi:ribose transport system permease protein